MVCRSVSLAASYENVTFKPDDVPKERSAANEFTGGAVPQEQENTTETECPRRWWCLFYPRAVVGIDRMRLDLHRSETSSKQVFFANWTFIEDCPSHPARHGTNDKICVMRNIMGCLVRDSN